MEEEKKKKKNLKPIIIILSILIIGMIIAVIILIKMYEQAKLSEDLDTIKSLIEDKDYSTASEKLSELSNTTQENKDVKQQVNELTDKVKREEIDKIKNEQEVTVESAKIIVSESEYRSLYPDGIEVIIKNNTEKTIKDYKVSILGYDENNFPVKVSSKYNFGGKNYEFTGNAEAANIMPGKTYGKDVGWELSDNHGISKVIAIVKEAKYYDGSIWENPYYKYWIEEHKEKPLQ